jgi:hypothetical protein
LPLDSQAPETTDNVHEDEMKSVSLCYDDEALEAMKEHKPKGNAIGLATAMGIELLTGMTACTGFHSASSLCHAQSLSETVPEQTASRNSRFVNGPVTSWFLET